MIGFDLSKEGTIILVVVLVLLFLIIAGVIYFAFTQGFVYGIIAILIFYIAWLKLKK